MTEREKIIKVIDEWANKAVKANKFDGASVYNPHNAAELADAIIAAGIGDLKEHRIFAGKDGSIKQLYSGEEVEKIVKERKELKDELRSKVEYIHEQDEVIKEYKHRAEVAENELKLYKLAVKIWQERYSDIRCFNFNIALRQAERELAEEETE